MKAAIKRITLENFKGITNKVIDLEGKNFISGKNGSGKTTISTAYYWLFGDADYSVKKNPEVSPLGMDEVSPRVEIVMDIDGKEITVAKIQ